MSRCTQYVGLTDRASNFINGNLVSDNLKFLENKYNDKDIHFEKRFASGFEENEIPLGTWRRILNGREVFIREVVQCTPWSSGPMIITCLEIDFGNGDSYDKPGDEKYDRTSTALCFQWIDDPTVECEADRATGRMWI